VDLLKNLAAQTKGTFSVVSPGKTDLSGVQSEIEKSATRPLAEMLVTNLEERFQIPLAVGVVATALLLLGGTRFRFPSRKAAAALAILLLVCGSGADLAVDVDRAAIREPGYRGSAGPGIAGAQPPAMTRRRSEPKGRREIAASPIRPREARPRREEALEERVEDAVKHFRRNRGSRHRI
jgi:hypothetical protein